MVETIICGTVDEARDYAQERGSRVYITSPEILERIRAAEEAGGFEGGMTGAAGEGGYSAPGSGALNRSEQSDPVEIFDLDGAVNVGGFIEGVIERYFDFKDLWQAWEGKEPLGPIILVPLPELKRWLYGSGPGA